MGDLLRCLISEKPSTWDLLLPIIEFANNNSANCSTGKSPFEIVPGLSARPPIDLVPLLPESRSLDSATTFADHIRALHDEVRSKIYFSNDSYQLAVNAHHRYQDFKEGDYVKVQFYWECFLKHSFKKLHARSIGPYRIV